MNTIDFSFLGGFPLEQDTLNFMQSATINSLKSFFGDTGSTPVIISGMRYTNVGGTHTLTAGYFFYNGFIHHCPGAVLVGLLAGTQVGVAISPSTTGIVVFEDNSSQNVYIQRPTSFTYISLAPGVNEIPVGDFKLWHEYLGDRGRDSAWRELVINAFSVTGTLFYKADLLARTLRVRATLTVGNAQAITDPPIYHQLGTLPVGYRPLNTSPFPALIRYHDNLGVGYNLEASGTDYMKQLNAEVSTAGHLNIGLIRPDAAVASYTVHFNHILPLD